MAIWHLYRQSDGHLGLTYENRIDGRLFKCGSLRSDTPMPMIIEWVLDQKATQTFDWIRLEGGGLLQVLPPCPMRM